MALRRVGAVFDIDGVLIRGKKALAGAAASLRRLDDAGIPWICATNGGGVLEAAKAAELSKLIDHPVEASQMICCHTPFRSLVPEFGKQRVLVLGCRDVIGVARSYGFEDVVSIRELAEDDPSRYPFIDWEHRPLEVSLEERPVAAAFVFHDPVEWAPDVQITLDCLRGGTPHGTGAGQAIPFFHANPDVVFAGTHAAPRLASGAFLEVMSHVFRTVVGTPLRAQLVGKPTSVTFDFAKFELSRRREHLSELRKEPGSEPHAQGYPATSAAAAQEPFGRIFMVGDNPAADIRGANQAGGPWRSVLVRTGVFSTGDNDPHDPAWKVVDDVSAAVDVVLEASERV